MRLAMSNKFAKSFYQSPISSFLVAYSNKFSAFTNLFKSDLKSLIPYQVTLEKDQVFRVPSAYRELRILSGIAWITGDGEDIILTSGQKASLTSSKGGTVLSALGNVPLTLEVL